MMPRHDSALRISAAYISFKTALHPRPEEASGIMSPLAGVQTRPSSPRNPRDPDEIVEVTFR